MTDSAEKYTRIKSESDGFENDEYQFGRFLSHPEHGEEVVISGLSGVYPESENIEQFQANLYAKKDMVTQDDRRWTLDDHPEIPRRSGKLLDLEKFDAGFFGIHHTESNSLDPATRIYLEKSIEAIMDAGWNPSELEGSKTGVFVAACWLESGIIWCRSNQPKTGSRPCRPVILGTMKSTIANRVSYFLKLEGPSMALDSACSSGLFALEAAYRAIRNGQCDSAVVGSVNLCLHPNMTLQFNRLGVHSQDGACKVFDEAANGYVRSEAIVSVFLQKLKNARRVYGKIVHAKTNCDGYKAEGITHPCAISHQDLYIKCYQECGMDPRNVSFLEAHGTGTKIGDGQEIKAIDSVFCKNRNQPLFVGSTKSNAGHAESSSALMSLSKVIIGLENGLMPANIHFKKARTDIAVLREGRVKVLTEPLELAQPNQEIVVGLNSFGFGGANGHMIVTGYPQNKRNDSKQDDNDFLPRLICLSGRTRSSLDHMFDRLSSTKYFDKEHIGLFHRIFGRNINGHLCRGYTILSKSGEIARSSASFDGFEGQLYFYFDCYGSFWSSATSELGVLPVFQSTIQRIYKILRTQKIQPPQANHGNGGLMSKKDVILTNSIVMLALVDLFKHLGLAPCGVFGRGIGKFICAYQEEWLTLQQTINFILGTLSDIKHNFINDKIKNHGRGIEQRRIKSKGRHILASNNVKKWSLVTSRQRLSVKNDRFRLLEDFLNNLYTNFSDLEKSVKDIPSNSTVLQFGGDMMSTRNFASGRRIHLLYFKDVAQSDCFIELLKILGELYQLGFNNNTEKLYPEISFPVSRGTPMISPFIKWNHDKNWMIAKYEPPKELSEWERHIKIELGQPEWSYLFGHVIDGRILLPAACHLFLVWETMSQVHKVPINQTKVVFENCKFITSTTLVPEVPVHLTISIQKITGKFEIVEGNSVVATGRVHTPKTGDNLLVPYPEVSAILDENTTMGMDDIYKELHLRGYNYKGDFKTISLYDRLTGNSDIKWTGNWTTFLDSFLQLHLLENDTRMLGLPTLIERIFVDPSKHQNNLSASLKVSRNKAANVTRCDVLEIKGVQATFIDRTPQRNKPVLEKYLFIPNIAQLSIMQSIRVNMQIILENTRKPKLDIIELNDNDEQEILSPLVQKILEETLVLQSNITVLSKKAYSLANIIVKNEKLCNQTKCSLVIGTKFLHTLDGLHAAFDAIHDNGYVLSQESQKFNLKNLGTRKVQVVTQHSTDQGTTFVLLKRKMFLDLERFVAVDMSDTEKFSWLPVLQKTLKSNPNVIIFAQNKPSSGVLGLVNCLRKEPGGHKLKLVFTSGPAPPFQVTNPFYTKQLEKDLAINIYRDSQWGTYRHLRLDPKFVETEHCFASCMVRGNFSSINRIEGPLRTDDVGILTGNKLVHVYYSALNFRDVMLASGKIKTTTRVMERKMDQQHVLGLEFSGRTIEGERVTGIVRSKGLGSLVLPDVDLLFPVPDSWSLEDAATVPLVYLTVLQAFLTKVKIKSGQSILIHAGSGGIGQAAINIALFYGLEVYTTVGSREKKEFLMENFPELKKQNIGNSRDVSFEQMIQQRTRGKGVDYVLNSLSEEKLLASVRCLAANGNFLEIGVFDLTQNNDLNLVLLEKEASFHSLELYKIFERTPQEKVKLGKLFTENIAKGAVKPIRRTVYDGFRDVEKAFRTMGAGKHLGKILIKIRDEEKEPILRPRRRTFQAIPRFYCNPEKVQIVIGGLGGFGLELTDWLVSRGARKIILVTRHGPRTGYQFHRISLWRSYKAQIHISKADITTKNGCQQLIDEANRLGDVESIFNLAVDLRNSILENQTVENFKASFASKAQATGYLDEITRRCCPNLKNFIAFSSIVSGRGNAGQSTYGMSNAAMEGICENRVQDGYPGLAIQWSAIGDVGILANSEQSDRKMIDGCHKQCISSCLEVLDQLLTQNSPIVSSMVVRNEKNTNGCSKNIIHMVGNILGLSDLKAISKYSTLPQLGMDSITTIEIKQAIDKELGIELSSQEIRTLTFAKLEEMHASARNNSQKTSHNGKIETAGNTVPTYTVCEEHSKIPLVKIETSSLHSTQIICFPGIEGTSAMMQPLFDKLNGSVMCVQYSVYGFQETVTDIVEYSLLTLLPEIAKNRPICVIGYSFGSSVALEATSILEKEGYECTIICIDGAPQIQRAFFDNWFSTNLESKIILKTIELLGGSDSGLSEEQIEKFGHTFDEKLQQTYNTIFPRSIIISSWQFFQQLAKSLLARAKTLKNYQPSYGRIQSHVMLFKPTFMSVSGLSTDYGLNDLCKNQPEIRNFEGDHRTILQNSKLSEAINQVLIRMSENTIK